MRVVMINDCAHVGEILLRYLPNDVKGPHIKRSRGLWSKTLGIAWKILKAQGDIYHVHYLLQDCYLTLKFGKRPVVGHAHGSDVRTSLKHFTWGRIVRHNLKSCDKLLVSTPDLLEKAQKYQEDAEYLPSPVDIDLFVPIPNKNENKKIKVLIGSKCDWEAKRTHRVIEALKKIEEEVDVSLIHYGKDFHKTISKANAIGLKVNVLPKVPHDEIQEYFWNSDVVVGTIGAGVMGMVSLEAVSCGRPVVNYVSSEYEQFLDWEPKDVETPDEISDAILSYSSYWKTQYEYVKNYHNPRRIATRLYEIYEEVRTAGG